MSFSRVRATHIALLCGAVLVLTGCGQKGPLYLSDDREREPQPLELSEQELERLQEELAEQPQSPRRTTDEALKSETYGGSLFPNDPTRR
jgi:predicted small lipoprotein YifL